MVTFPPIVVIAQIKNERRSLPRFLQTCETFADRIILLDQGSTDGSAKIAAQFSKAKVFDNPDRHLDEANTIARMYELARSEVQGSKIILRLDADEVLSANATNTAEWNTLRNAEPGTVICIPRVELFSFEECYAHSIIDRGFVDDGRNFKVKQIHASSTPIALGLPTLTCNRISILHYSGLRRKLGEAKMRYYCMLDNVYRTRPVFERRILYRQGHILDIIRLAGRRVSFDEAWIKGYETKGIDMTSVLDDQSTWHDAACIDLMVENGAERFFMDPIWYYDWEGVIRSLPAEKRGVAEAALRRPPRYLRKVGGIIDRIYKHNRMPLKSREFLNSYFASVGRKQSL
jgi:glycosyltransferase involved in cell wall biosynthesis